VLLFAFTKLTNIFLVAERRQRFIAAQSFAEQALRAGAMLGLVPIMGLSGLAVAETFAYGFVVISKYHYLVRTGFIQNFPFSALMHFDETDRMYVRQAAQSVPLIGKYVLKG
jgi:O-antigen/teichoic acid export membrane protein